MKMPINYRKYKGTGYSSELDTLELKGDYDAKLEETESFEETTLEEENSSSESFFATFCSMNKLTFIFSILIITIAATICFPNLVLKIIMITEMVGVALYLFYDTYKYIKESDQEDDEEENILVYDKRYDGFEVIPPSEDGISLSELVVQSSVKELDDLVNYLKNPEEFGEFIPQKKILLLGQNGSGKDTLIKAFANDLELPIFRIHASRFFEKKDIMEELFKIASTNSDFTYIIQIDSIEILLGSNSEGAGVSIADILLDQLNINMNVYENIILFGTSENLAAIAPTLSSQKMFKKIVVLEAPNLTERIQLLKKFSETLIIDDAVDFENIAKNCVGNSIGEIKYYISTVASFTRRKGHDKITEQDFFDAFDELNYGISSKKHSKEMQKLVAYHEAGHALVNYLLNDKRSIIRVVSTSHGNAGGFTLSSPDEDRWLLTKDDLMNEICSMYGGRVAEKIIFNHLSTGASSDIQMATSLIMSMIQQYGMSDEIGPINVSPKIALLSVIPESTDMQNLISKECVRIAKECEALTTALLYDHRNKLDALATYLINHESITGAEMEKLLKDIED